MSNYQDRKKTSDELPERYPAEIFIDFVLTQGYELVEDALTYTIVKNEDLGITERIYEDERYLSSFQIESILSDMKIPIQTFIEYLREMELRTKERIDFFIDRSFQSFKNKETV